MKKLLFLALAACALALPSSINAMEIDGLCGYADGQAEYESNYETFLAMGEGSYVKVAPYGLYDTVFVWDPVAGMGSPGFSFIYSPPNSDPLWIVNGSGFAYDYDTTPSEWMEYCTTVLSPSAPAEDPAQGAVSGLASVMMSVLPLIGIVLSVVLIFQALMTLYNRLTEFLGERAEGRKREKRIEAFFDKMTPEQLEAYRYETQHGKGAKDPYASAKKRLRDVEKGKKL